MVYDKGLEALRSRAPEAVGEIARHRAKQAGFSSGEGVSGRGGMWPVLTDRAAEQLVAVYQDGLEAARLLPTARRKVTLTRRAEDGSRAAEALCGSMFRLGLQMSSEAASRSRGVDPADLRAAAQLAVLEAAAAYRPEEHRSFSAWASTIMRRRISSEAQRAGGDVPASWRRVIATARRAEEEAWQQQIRMDEGQLREDVRRRISADIRANLAEADPELTGEQLDGRVEAALVRQGLSAAIGNLGRIRQLASAQASLILTDEKDEDDPDRRSKNHEQDTPAYTPVHDMGELAAALFGADMGTAAAAAEYLTSEGEPGVTYDSVAARHRIPSAQLRAAVRTGRVRARSPHALYAHLSEAAERQILDMRGR